MLDNFAKRIIDDGQTSISNLLLSKYASLGMNNEEFVIYLQIKSFIDRGNRFPDIEIISNNTGIDKNHIYEILHNLIKNKIMQIKTIELSNGKTSDVYDFSLLYDKLANLDYDSNDNELVNKNSINNVAKSIRTASDDTDKLERKDVFQKIEQEFGRSLSPIELETISQWIDSDDYSFEMILLALKESVLNQVRSLKYMDRILLNWEKSNIRTPYEVEMNRKKRNQVAYKKNSTNKKVEQGPDIPIFKLD